MFTCKILLDYVLFFGCMVFTFVLSNIYNQTCIIVFEQLKTLQCSLLNICLSMLCGLCLCCCSAVCFKCFKTCFFRNNICLMQYHLFSICHLRHLIIIYYPIYYLLCGFCCYYHTTFTMLVCCMFFTIKHIYHFIFPVVELRFLTIVVF